MESYLIVETHMWSRKNHLELWLFIQWSFHHYRNKLAERYFDSQLFFLSRHRFKERFFGIMGVGSFENSNISRNKKMSKFQFIILICLNLMESIASRIKQTKLGINIKLKLKLAFKVIQNIGGKKDERILYFLRCF
jgi:hypothetical protein